MPDDKAIFEDKQRRLNAFSRDKLFIDAASKSVRYCGDSVPLPDLPMKVLIFLHNLAPGLGSRDDIFDEVWSERPENASSNVVDQTIGELRTRLPLIGLTIENFPRIGFGIAVTSEFDEANDRRKALQTTLSDNERGVVPARSRIGPTSESIPPDQDTSWEDFILGASCPDEHVRTLASHCGAADRRSVGSVVEVFGHPYLESGLPLDETGWAASTLTA
jgi:DNA-binding winged helix-turn-helix (wHTH) protein